MPYVIHIITGILLGVASTALTPNTLWETSRKIIFAASNFIILTVLIPRVNPATAPFLPVMAGNFLGHALGLGYRFPWVTTAFAAILTFVLLGFIEIRHTSLRRRRRRHPLTYAARRRRGVEDQGEERPLYVLAVLGSGGHTKEMFLMMGNDFHEPGQSHRRYLVTGGDNFSLKQAEAFEESLREAGEHPGTYDVRVATRARRVHQSLLTTPMSALRSIFDIFPILLARPGQIAPGSPLDLPDVIFTNGPATGFFVGLVAHMLKIFCVVPEHKMQVLFIESWARVSSLSLTGKLFYHSGIADMFLVQHESVATVYGVLNAGWLVLDPSQMRGDVL